MGKKKSKAAPKAKRQAVKKPQIRHVEIFEILGGREKGFCFGVPDGEVVKAGYARAFTAMRGAKREYKDFLANGGQLYFVKNY